MRLSGVDQIQINKHDKEKQLELLALRIQKVDLIIALFEPHTLKASKKRATKLWAAVALVGIIIIVPAALNIKGGPESLHDDLLAMAIGLGVACELFALLGMLVIFCHDCLDPDRHHRNLERQDLLSDLRKIQPDFVKFIQSLPTEEFLNSPQHIKEVQALEKLRDITLNWNFILPYEGPEIVIGRLTVLRNIYQTHVQTLNSENMHPGGLQYEPLIKEAETLLDDTTQIGDTTTTGGETKDTRLRRAEIVNVNNNNNDPGLLSKASGASRKDFETESSALRFGGK